MTIYNIIELFFLLLLFIEIKNPNHKHRNLLYFLCTLTLVIVLGLRNYDVGGDTPGYCDFFNGDPSGFYGSLYDKQSEIEIGFIYFTRLLKFIIDDWRWFIFATSLVTLIPFLWATKKYAINVSFAFVSFMLTFNLIFLVQTPIRQDIAISLFIIGSYILLKEMKKDKKRTFIIVVSLFILVWGIFTHTTMYLVAPIAIGVYFLNFTKKASIIAILSTFSLSVLIKSLFSYVFDFLNYITIAYNIFDNVNRYYDNDNYELTDENTILIIGPLTFVALITILLSSKEQIKSYLFKCYIIAVCIMNISVSFPLASRVGLFFSLIAASFVPQKINSLYRNNKKEDLLVYALFLFYILLANRHYNMCRNFKTVLDSDILPYSFWL